MGLRKGRKPPDWYFDKPQSMPYDDFAFRAFSELGTTRRYEGGPIPWDVIMKYAAVKKLTPRVSSWLAHVISEMDGAYLDYLAQERKSG